MNASRKEMARLRELGLSISRSNTGQTPRNLFIRASKANENGTNTNYPMV